MRSNEYNGGDNPFRVKTLPIVKSQAMTEHTEKKIKIGYCNGCDHDPQTCGEIESVCFGVARINATEEREQKRVDTR